MATDILSQLKAIDPAILIGVVRKSQCSPDMEILDWTVEPINHEKVIDTTGGLLRFNGHGRRGQSIQPWTVALKCVHNPKVWAQEPTEWAYWQRESLALQSGLLENLPPGVRAPRCYGGIEKEDDAWVWIEYIQEATGKQWPLETFQRTARQLGRFQAAYLSGTPLPQRPWLCRPFFRSIWADQDWWSGFMNPDSKENAWNSPIVQGAFDEKHQSRLLHMLADKQLFFDANDRLPQVLCHNDAHRRNFMWARSSQNDDLELIGIDWAFTGPGALGNDLGELVGHSTYFFDYDPYDVATLETAAIEGYQAGLADSGVKIDPRLVRLGYVIALSFWMGAMIPGWAASMLPSGSGVNVQAMYGHPVDEVLAGWVQLDAYFLDRADEARSLIHQLGL